MTSPERNQLTDWGDELFRVDQEVRLELEPLNEEQFAWRPGPNRWSIGECLNHLAITTGLMLEQVRPALERGRSEQRTGVPPFKLGRLGGWFARLMDAQQKLRNTLDAANGLALDRIKAGSAAKGAGWLRLNVAAWLATTLAHQRRHVAQAKRVRETAGFPA